MTPVQRRVTRGATRRSRRRAPARALPDELAGTVARRVGAHLRALRLRAGLTQADLAGAALSRAGVAKIESGASAPSLDTLEYLAAALGRRVRDLLPDHL